MTLFFLWDELAKFTIYELQPTAIIAAILFSSFIILITCTVVRATSAEAKAKKLEEYVRNNLSLYQKEIMRLKALLPK
jgi:hypothetical protein